MRRRRHRPPAAGRRPRTAPQAAPKGVEHRPLVARFLLQLPDAPVVLRALRPEARSSPGASVALRRGTLELRLRGTTPSSLRSQVNAWLRLVEVAVGAAAAAGPARKV